MSKIVWDAIGERLYETGTKQGVVYPQVGNAYPAGAAWNGLTGFNVSPDGGDATDIWADDIKYLSIRARENFKATITAYTYPDEFAICNGTAAPIPGVSIGQQARKPFGFSCVTTVGNDTEFEDHGYKLHLVWGATASPSSEDYKTINDSPEAIEFSWEITSTPVNVTNFKPTSHMVIDSTKFKTTEEKAKLAALEDILYGSDAVETYVETEDETWQNGKTYYISGRFIPTSDTEAMAGKTYYELTSFEYPDEYRFSIADQVQEGDPVDDTMSWPVDAHDEHGAVEPTTQYIDVPVYWERTSDGYTNGDVLGQHIFEDGETYYEKVTVTNSPRLPLPDEVIQVLRGTV